MDTLYLADYTAQLKKIKLISLYLDLVKNKYSQNKYVCTRLFAVFDVSNWSLKKKVYILFKLVQFPIILFSCFNYETCYNVWRRDHPKSKFTKPSTFTQATTKRYTSLTLNFSVAWTRISPIYTVFKSLFNFLNINSKFIFLLQLWDLLNRLEEDIPRNKGAWQKMTLLHAP